MSTPNRMKEKMTSQKFHNIITLRVILWNFIMVKFYEVTEETLQWIPPIFIIPKIPLSTA